MKKLILFCVLLCVAGVTCMAGCTQPAPSTPTPTPTPTPVETTVEETPAGVTGNETGMENETGTGAEVADTVINEMIKAGNYVAFLDYVYLTGVNEDLSGPGPYTVFAPLDEGVEEYISQDKETEMRAYPEVDLRPLVLGHIVEGTYTSADLTTPTNLTTLAGTTIEVATVDGAVTVNGIKVVTADLEAGNGVIHGIEGVILPSDF
ncbi:fasciclin domain-containing protein [Methanofollis formosanus]|nr:fasciclin domain-containing protein [Methanofollis formosanus]